MKNEIRKVLILVNLLKKDPDELVAEISAFLNKLNIETQVNGYNGEPLNTDVDDVDLAISLGGDGTVLYSARLLASRKVPILAVNLGNFGFITEVSKTEWKMAFEKYRCGMLGLSKRLMLDVKIDRNGKIISQCCGLNDAVISADGISKVIRLKAAIQSTNIGTYRADGVIVASPTGSTAYSAAAGGPILDADMEAMILSPICPFTLSNRPIVFPGDEEICLTVEEYQRSGIILTVDGQLVYKLEPKDKVFIRKYEEKALIIRSDKRNFFEVLRSKLHWSGGPDA